MSLATTFVLLANGAEQPLTSHSGQPPAYTIGTIAHQLAQINRYAGAASRPYSVAEHSLLCADLADEAGCAPIVQLCCLMHDAHESVVGDVSTPVKRLLGDAWTALAAQHARTLRAHFGLQRAFLAHRVEIHAIDLQALATERRDLLQWQTGISTPWPQLDAPGQPVRAATTSLNRPSRAHMHWSEWRDAFEARYHDLHAVVTHDARTAARAEAAA